MNSVSEDEEDEKKCDLDAMDDSEDGDEADEEEESDNDENMISKTFAVLTGPVDSKQRVAPENLSATGLPHFRLHSVFLLTSIRIRK